MRMKKLLALAMVAAMSITAVGCGSTASEGTTKADSADMVTEGSTQPVTDNLEGTITITGSTSVEKIVNDMIDEFQALNPGTTINYTGSGSSAGIKDTIAGTNNIGVSSREIKEEEKPGIVETKFATDGIAVIVHPENKVTDLTKEQLNGIYSGKITNWKEVGGADSEIYVVSREESSGTRSGFEELVEIESLSKKATVAEGNGPVQISVAGNKNAIGYVSFSFIDDTVKGLQVGGVDPTVENVNANTYVLSRPFLFVTKEDAADDASGKIAKAFLEFAVSADGQTCVSKHDAITLQ